MCVRDQAPAPAAGALETRTSPARSTATHSDGDAQDTPTRATFGPTFATVHALAPPVGSVEVRILPRGATATHREGAGQEIPVGCTSRSSTRFHAPAPPAGLLAVRTSPG